MSRTKKAKGKLSIFSRLARNRDLIIIGIGMAIALGVFLKLTDLQRDTYWFEAVFFMPFILYIIAIYWAYKTRSGADDLEKKVSKKEAMARQKEVLYIILAFAIIFRAIFLFTTPTVSDDIYRFYWEGKVAAHGINPYQYAPDSVELEKFRDANWQFMNNRDVPSPYPPFSQMTFMYCYLMHPATDGIFLFKAFFTFFDMMSVYVLFQLLRNFKIDPRMSMVYAWSPLVILEFSQSGHNDSVAIFFVLFSFLALQKGNKVGSAAALALGALTKVFPLMLAPVMFKAWGKKGIAVFLVMMAIFYLPYIGAGQAIFTGISEYTDRWLFNGSVFAAIVNILESTVIVSTRPEAMMVAKLVVAFLFAPVLAFLIYLSRKNWDRPLELFKYAFVIIGLFLLLTSTVQPWYIIWVMPFLCVFLMPSWILLSGTAILSYIIYIRFDTKGIWDEALWVRLVEYLPFYALLGIELAMSWMKTKDGLRSARTKRPQSTVRGEEE